MSDAIFKNLFIILFLGAVGCQQEGGSSPAIEAEGFDFKPIFRGGSRPTEAANGIPIPPKNFKVSARAGGGVVISWDFPKSYVSSEERIGWRVFRKVPTSAGEITWDFNPVSEDWENAVGTIAADECTRDGFCALLDRVGGPAVIGYAAIAYWNVEDLNSPRSTHVTAVVKSDFQVASLEFGEAFMDKPPFQTIGSYVAEVDRVPSSRVLSFAGKDVPWFLLEASENSITAKSWAKAAGPVFPSVDPKLGLDMLLPDHGFNRLVKLSKGSLSDCDIFGEDLKDLCLQILISQQMSPLEFAGQASYTQSLIRSANPLPESRKFSSRATSIQYGESGTRYFFVADEARILVRSGDIYSCGNDPGEDGDDKFGPEGHCGFSLAIGTLSPRLRCAFRADGSVTVGETPCTDADMARSLADGTPPTDFSLRYPGAPKIVGKHLYIPDSGNARVVRLPNFEDKIKTCGKLPAKGEPASAEFCRFDLVIGQTSSDVTNPDDASRFTRRTCVRGGERGGYDELGPVAEATPFVDPLGLSGSGGAACRLDMMADSSGGVSFTRRARQAGDYKDETKSDISPETGLLAETTRRTFRAPVAIEVDEKGRLYVLDFGFTRVRSTSGDSVGILPTRIMVWNRDPFSFEKCTPTDPAAEVPSCSIDQDGRCSGVGCASRQCAGSECNSTVALGQGNILYGFPMVDGQDLDVVKPDGYYPISSFAVGKENQLRGIWAVTGRDARVLHWPEPSQTARPTIHNALSGDPTVNEPAHKTGVFAGITIDEVGGFLTGWDTKYNIGISWYGDVPGVTVPGGEETGTITNVSKETWARPN